ncbi:MAG: hypothetical protein AABX88_01500 [Nanoarchaeota archaeon]
MEQDQPEHQLSIFGNSFDDGLGILALNYGVECVYLGDALLEDIGPCQVYIPLDIRDNQEKYKKNFDQLIFEIDGKIIHGAQFNSVLLSRSELEAFPKTKIKLNFDAPNIEKKPVEEDFLYEIIAVGNPGYALA